jgi:hypothetical protein
MLPEKPPVKLIMQWNIQYGKDQEYFNFIMNDWSLTMTRIGLRVLAAWFSIYTRDPSQPRIMAEAYAPDRLAMRDILRSDEWQQLQARLMNYVEDYHQKVVYVNGDFQL